MLFWDGSYNDYLAFNLLTIGDVMLWISFVFLGLLGVTLYVWRMIKVKLIYRD